jgi:nucleotide-binding universal stress UspA family protein
MFKRLLVPLDGSKLAESVLPMALSFAEKFGATILLFHALEQDARSTIHGDRHLSATDEAEAYLSDVAARLTRPNVVVTKHVHTAIQESEIARSIIDHAVEHPADLIVLCAHGSSGWRDRFVGNIAQQVISRGTTPVLFVNPEKAENTAQYDCRKILLPLDGSSQHEPALPLAEQAARAFGSAIRLVCVVPTVGTLSAERAGAGMLLPTTMTEILEFAQRGAVEYLQGALRTLSAESIPATAEVARGDIAPAILNAIKRANADLVVMATHGRTSMDAFWSGSVTPKVLAQSNVPVLLVRVTGEEVKR